MGGLKIRRQHPIGRFIADFYCHEARLIIEIDGGIHDLQTDRDSARTEYLEQRGYRVTRIHNEEVARNIEQVLAHIVAACNG